MLKVILELANNHCGSIQHGYEIIEKFDSVTIDNFAEIFVLDLNFSSGI